MELEIHQERSLKSYYRNLLSQSAPVQLSVIFSLLQGLQSDFLESEVRICGVFLILEYGLKQGHFAIVNQIVSIIGFNQNLPELALLNKWLTESDCKELKVIDALQLDYQFNLNEIICDALRFDQSKLCQRVRRLDLDLLYQNFTNSNEFAVSNTQSIEFLKKSTVSRLNAEETKIVCDSLAENQYLTFQGKILPEKFEQIVVKNPQVALSILLSIIHLDGIEKYLSQLLDMHTDCGSLEVMYRLIMRVELPEECIDVFIINCIKSIKDTNDKGSQRVLVRCVSIFMKNLISTSTIKLAEKFVVKELNKLCSRFPEFKETRKLYKLLPSD